MLNELRENGLQNEGVFANSTDAPPAFEKPSAYGGGLPGRKI